jgi:hypothetical protein
MAYFLTLIRFSQMKAEEKYGLNGFVYVGSGKYEARPGAQIAVPPPTVSAETCQMSHPTLF